MWIKNSFWAENNCYGGARCVALKAILLAEKQQTASSTDFTPSHTLNVALFASRKSKHHQFLTATCFLANTWCDGVVIRAVRCCSLLQKESDTAVRHVVPVHFSSFSIRANARTRHVSSIKWLHSATMLAASLLPSFCRLCAFHQFASSSFTDSPMGKHPESVNTLCTTSEA